MSRKLLSLSLLILIAILAFSGIAQAQDKTLYWQRYDVDLAPQKNGDLHVTETQELVFTNGTFQYGQRAIPMDRLGEIKNIQVRELDGVAVEIVIDHHFVFGDEPLNEVRSDESGPAGDADAFLDDRQEELPSVL